MGSRGLYYGCLVMFAAHIGIYGLGPIIPLYARKVLGATPALVFLTTFSRDVVQILLRIPLGALSDRVGRKPLMTLGLACYAVAQAVCFVAPSPEALLLAMAVIGVGLSAFIPSSQAWFAELAREGRMGEAIGMRDMAMTLTMMVGPPVCGSLALLFPAYRPIFLVTLGLTLIGIVALSLSAETHPSVSSTGWISCLRELGRGIAMIPRMLGGMFRDRGMLASSTATFFSGFISGPFESYYTLYSSARLGLDEVMISTGFTARGLASALSITYWGRLSDRIGRLWPMAAGLALLALVLTAIPSVSPYLLLILLVSLLGLGNALVIPAAQAGAAESVGSGAWGAGMGVWGTMLRLGMAVGSLVMSAIVSFVDLTFVFYVAAIASAMGVLALLVVKRSE